MSETNAKSYAPRYTSVLVAADDGSDDVWLPIPNEILSEMGCVVGDAIELEVENGRLYMRKATGPT